MRNAESLILRHLPLSHSAKRQASPGMQANSGHRLAFLRRLTGARCSVARDSAFRTPHSAFLRSGAVLLEVILAMTLFFMAAGVVVGALDSALRGAKTLKLEAQAADLAMSKLADIQSSLTPPVAEGATEYKEEENLPGWTCEVAVEKMGVANEAAPPMSRVTVIIRKPDQKFTYQISQLILTLEPEAADDSSASGTGGTTGGATGGNTGGGGTPRSGP